jgi:hypothetical protein
VAHITLPPPHTPPLGSVWRENTKLHPSVVDFWGWVEGRRQSLSINNNNNTAKNIFLNNNEQLVEYHNTFLLLTTLYIVNQLC